MPKIITVTNDTKLTNKKIHTTNQENPVNNEKVSSNHNKHLASSTYAIKKSTTKQVPFESKIKLGDEDPNRNDPNNFPPLVRGHYLEENAAAKTLAKLSFFSTPQLKQAIDTIAIISGGVLLQDFSSNQQELIQSAHEEKPNKTNQPKISLTKTEMPAERLDIPWNTF